MTLPLCVLVASRRGYENWLLVHGLSGKDTHCAATREHIMGCEFRRIVTTNEFWDHNPDATEMYALALSRVRTERPRP
jgi:hypothetical protein